MDALDEARAGALGRGTSPRRYRTTEEKRRIVEETMAQGASVALIARKHEVNANLLFGWRRLYHKGLLGTPPTIPATPLLPVRVAEEAAPSRRLPVSRGRKLRRSAQRDPQSLEIELANGSIVRVRGDAASEILRQLVNALCPR